ncbi:methyltransferase type 11 [Maritimibacter sp. 55A14]|uniref:class I SAM-dependent DNA methyltransferase n=1 Tax=Maritimibacter sp. 55A14 TaxID=2174844 RepID=UPI000D60CC24|nr:class I SAM-dependent methyltransferase [Maritimibacter sp. 55A14]PWE34312.1 methyltransferase type 11 [Maritimibacter sp. 55A14]
MNDTDTIEERTNQTGPAAGRDRATAPQDAAAALRDCGADTGAPLLDFGCGNGISGAAFADAGFRVIDGMDPSPRMLERAAARNIYRGLWQIVPGRRLPSGNGPYDNIAALCAIGPGAAPPETFDGLFRLLKRGGYMILCFNAETLADARFEARIAEYVDCCAAEVLCRDQGDQIPGTEPGAVVYVLRKR